MTYLTIIDINELIVEAVNTLISVDPADIDPDGYRHVTQLRDNLAALVDMVESKLGSVETNQEGIAAAHPAHLIT